MMLSQTAEYALRTVLHIARTGSDGPANADAMATSLGIPRNYLSKVLHRLAQAGVLTSTRGRNGGFVLARDPGKISLAAVVGLFDRIEPRLLRGRGVEAFPICRHRERFTRQRPPECELEEGRRFFRRIVGQLREASLAGRQWGNQRAGGLAFLYVNVRIDR